MKCHITNRNHFTYWIVSHWNRLKLVTEVSLILLESLNWRIYQVSNPSKSVPLRTYGPIISSVVPAWFEVLSWYWIIKWLDLPSLQTITLGGCAFNKSILTIFESIEWICMKYLNVDLPSLQSIALGHCSLIGKWFDSTDSVIMRSNYKMIQNDR